MMHRLVDKLADLLQTLEHPDKRWKSEPNTELIERLKRMKQYT